VSDQSDIITTTFAQLGVQEPEYKIYRYLLGKPPQSALAISRDAHLPRTRVYRILDKLIAKGLIQQIIGLVGTKYKAADSRTLQLLFIEKELEVKRIKEIFPSVLHQIHTLEGASEEKASIRYVEGLEGLKYVTWNSLNAKQNLYIIEKSDSMEAFIEKAFAEEFRRELVRKKITVWQLTTIDHIKPWTHVSECIRYWRVAYIDPKELSTVCELLTYNDIYAIYNWDSTNAFAIEIKNADVALMQQKLFHYLWLHAKPMRILNTYGEAVVTHPEK